ncbi:MAG TPA: glycosyl hydrolase family 28-related protein [Streptosporangiaceae bacterium]|nr:glycosyl hydrolase family 28-related protein [Streptosporangiaceae bacterium]
MTASPGVPARVPGEGWQNARHFGADPSGAADSTAAIQAALSAGAGGTYAYLPKGRYVVSAPLTISGPGLVGDGNGSQLLWDQAVVGTLVRASSAAAHQYVSIRDVRLSQTNPTPGGTAIDASAFQFSRIERVLIDKADSGAHPSIGVDYNNGITHYNVLRDCVINVDGRNAIGVRYSGGANSNVLENCRILPSTTDASQIGIYVNAYAIELDHPDIESVAGTAIVLDAGATSNRPTQLIAPYLENPNGTDIAVINGGCPPAMGSGRFTLTKRALTARASSATVAQDPDLGFRMLPSRVYGFRFMLIYDGPGSAAADLTMSLIAQGMPALVQWTVTGLALASLTAPQGQMTARIAQAAGTAVSVPTAGVGARTAAVAFAEGLVGPGAGGTFALQWAQRVANPTPTTLYAGSTLTVEQVS